ncbi:MAG TPA: methyltransferase domain-containing protein [Candidatus Elarobacter sp.]|jgi:SAM-dependent methyltransferase
MDEIERLAPWMYEFTFADGTRTPLMAEHLRAIHAVRLSMIVDVLDIASLLRGSTVLDVACNEGYFGLELAKRGAADVFGIDSRPRNIEKAEFARDRLALPNCRFTVGDVTEMALPPADVVLLLGIVYHVEDPIRLIRRAAAAARAVLFVETQLLKAHEPLRFGWGSPAARESPDAFAMLREDPAANDLSAEHGFSLVPNASAIVSVLRDIGFRSIAQLHPNGVIDEPQYTAVDRAVFAAFR